MSIMAAVAEWSRYRIVAGLVTSSNPVPLRTRHLGKRCTKLLGAVDTRIYPRAETGSGATRKTTRLEDRRIVRQALVDPTVTRSTIRADVGVAIVPQTISRYLAEANLKSKRPFRAFPLTSATACTVVPSQINLECYRLANGCV
ncbi:HTH_Tnp_Tc3_2 domain-containing protein [Trichonephila clavipes]|nr:HTH_Tnp_Tc3_2 domain-containing protein [Trichonephila clavipes]